ncbi:hypothetical protein G9A89_018565 [Geosiphon pyriformis]|nr:hypothetical protein G9A89_018565 [Geosiphon pyriformis]
MGKGTDKMYITHSEWSGEFGGMQFGGVQARKQTEAFKKLPFYCCSLSLQPFEFPYCTPEGIIFDMTNIYAYIKKFGTNPVTGEKLELRSLIKLNFYKNTDDEYHCPATFKVFSDHTHIVAIKTTGNVYSWEAIDRLNIKAKSWKDLITDEPFTRKDIITIQDPHNLEARNLSNFYYLKNNIKLIDEEEEKARSDPLYDINVVATGSAGKILAQITGQPEQSLETQIVNKEENKSLETSPRSQMSTAFVKAKPKKVPYNAAHYSTGRAAASLTSTAMTPVTENDHALLDEEEFMFKEIKEKGYARIVTNMGNLNVELFCDKSPRTCFNFIMLAKQGYYTNVIFHRKIKNFMIQGGDPTGTGKGGKSYWGKDFIGEFKSNLSHNERGLLSMANQGKNKNSSQFFFTFRPCTHLDNKHTIFGKIVGGKEVLDKMESVSTDETDRPLQEIKITSLLVFVDPFDQYQKKLQKKIAREKADPVKAITLQPKSEKDTTTWFGRTLIQDPKTKLEGEGIGKYLQSPSASKKRNADVEINDIPSNESTKKKAKPTGYDFSDFSNW